MEREFTFWYNSDVLRLTVRANDVDEAWEKLENAIQGVVPDNGVDLTGGARVAIANIGDEGAWELDAEDAEREGIMDLED